MVLELLPKAPKPSEQTNSEAIVYLHTSIKGLELGLVLGSTIGILYSLIRQRKVNPSKVSQFINYGVGLGIVGTTIMTYSRVSQSDLAKNQSRAYRLERNPNQNTIDNFTLGGMLLGQVGLGGVLAQNTKKLALMKCWTGGLIGFWLGAVYLRIK